MSDRARYRIVRQIGAGGMGRVLEAVARGRDGFERRVAMKVMHADVAARDASARAAFVDEAKIASHLHHANIVQVLDYGVLGDADFIVVEYVDGPDMGRAARTRDVPVTVALHVVQEIAHALDHAHRRSDIAGRPLGIIHRDVTPSNMLVSFDGDVKLSDFGIAFAEGKEGVTAVGTLRGKAAYVAPEQMTGARPTPVVDVFALGVSLAGLLIGQPVTQLGRRILPDLPGVPSDVAELVERCLDPNPEARPSAREVAAQANLLRQARTRESGRVELTAWLAGETTALGTTEPGDVADTDEWSGRQVVADDEGTYRLGPSPPTNAPRPARRAGFLVAAGLAALVGLVALVAFDGRSAPSAVVEPTPAPQTARAVEPKVAPAVEAPAKVAPVAETPPAPPPPERRAPRPRRTQPKPAPAPSPPAAKAVLTIGGARLLRGWVTVDGKALRRQAPARLSLPVGRHRIVVEDAEGRVLLDRQVELKAHHTAVEPLRIIER